MKQLGQDTPLGLLLSTAQCGQLGRPGTLRCSSLEGIGRFADMRRRK